MNAAEKPTNLTQILGSYSEVDDVDLRRANRQWWDENASNYLDEHGTQLSPGGEDSDFMWGPEGLSEGELGLLGEIDDKLVLEVGSGAGQCSRYLTARGALAISLDVSTQMLSHSTLKAPVCADAVALPIANDVIDIAFSSYGALQFVEDSERLLYEIFRVLKSGGRWVVSLSHPIRWAFPDVPGPAGLIVDRSYFDTTAYTEHTDDGRLIYGETHRTIEQRIHEIIQAGLRLDTFKEIGWGNDPNRRSWGGWSRERGLKIPGTLILGAIKP